MRGSGRRRSDEEEGESVFVSMTDMTVSFLFIVMILLAFFATQVRPSEQVVAQSIHDRVVTERDALLKLVDKLKAERDTLDSELERARSELAVAAAKVTSLEISLVAAQREVKALKSALQEAIAESNDLRRKVEALEGDVARMKDEIARLKERLRRLDIRDPIETYIAQAAERRQQILRSLQEALKVDFPDLEVEISAQGDALRFRGDGIFSTGAWAIRDDKFPIITSIAQKLDSLLPCYTLGDVSKFSEACNPSFALVEAVQIEGHTDSAGSREENVRLSAKRGAETFIAMTRHVPRLITHQNQNQQPVLSLAGYGQERPVADNAAPQGQSQNRRIDLRIIMLSPRNADQIEEIRAQLQAVVDSGAQQ